MIILIRHLPTSFNRRGVFQGRIDNPIDYESISPNHIVNLSKIIKLISSKSYNLYSSPLKRCQQTTKLISKKTPKIDNRIIEFNFGEWQEKSRNNLSQKDQELWNKNFTSIKLDENYHQFSERINAFVKDLAKSELNIIITHGVVIRYLFCKYYLNNINNIDYMNSITIHPGSITILRS